MLSSWMSAAVSILVLLSWLPFAPALSTYCREWEMWLVPELLLLNISDGNEERPTVTNVTINIQN